MTSCSQISNGKYRTDDETSATVPVCGKNGAVFWKADMDIDCDGQRTTKCNENADPWYQDDTAFHQSNGQPLKADSLPYIVVPSSSSIWKYSSYGIKGGGVVAVIYNNKVEYAVVGDTGPTNIIGEASYATAKALGIDPDPATGGADSGVTYILFKNSTVSPSRATARRSRWATSWRSSSSPTTEPGEGEEARCREQGRQRVSPVGKLGRLCQLGCPIGRTTTVLMSTPAGWRIDHRIVSAIWSAVSRWPGGRLPLPSQNGVSTRPGATSVTPIPNSVTWRRVFSARPVIAHLVAP